MRKKIVSKKPKVKRGMPLTTEPIIIKIKIEPLAKIDIHKMVVDCLLKAIEDCKILVDGK